MTGKADDSASHVCTLPITKKFLRAVHGRNASHHWELPWARWGLPLIEKRVRAKRGLVRGDEKQRLNARWNLRDAEKPG
jgi:hypothetical protein